MDNKLSAKPLLCSHTYVIGSHFSLAMVCPTLANTAWTATAYVIYSHFLAFVSIQTSLTEWPEATSLSLNILLSEFQTQPHTRDPRINSYL